MAVSREAHKRGFKTTHQRVVLDLDFSGRFRGFTELTITPISDTLKTVNLHSRQANIHRVLVTPPLPQATPIQSDFVHDDPQSNINLTEREGKDGKIDVHRHPELKRKVYSALAQGDEGELSITLPKGCILRSNDENNISSNPQNVNSPSINPSTPNATQQQQQQSQTNSTPEFLNFTILIEYSISHPYEGLQVIKPTESSPYRVPHIYTSLTCPDAARCWTPCVDSLWERCTWELEFIVPRFLSAIGEDGIEDEQDEPVVVVSSGDLIEQVAHPSISSKTIFHYAQSLPTTVQHIAFAAGPFNVLPIPHSSNSTSSTMLHAFGPPGSVKDLASSVAIIPRALHFYSTEFGTYPFSSFKVVFVHDPPTDVQISSTLVILSLDLMHPSSAIEQNLDTRHKLSHALATQWSGINIMPRSWSDLWVVQGLANYISNLFLKKTLGNNEYYFRMKKDMDRIALTDTGQLPPLCVPNILEPPNENDAPFLSLKAPLVLHILDRKLSKSGTAHGLSRVLPKIFLNALSGDVIISTSGFLRTCRKVSGVDLRQFSDQWIYSSGTPRFSVNANFNRKKMCVEMSVKQQSPAFENLVGNSNEYLMNRPNKIFEGQMTIRIHEADGTPYEHVLDIRDSFKRYDVPFNTKYKRVRRNTKRYQARQAAAAAAAQGDEEAAEAIGMIDLGFQLNAWEDESERDRWKVEDWTEDDEIAMSQATYEWIRVDADFEWIASIKFEQPDFMWVSQLQRDRDVVAQLEAVHALSQIPSKLVSTMLTRTVLVNNYFFRIRMEAALVLHTCATDQLDFIGMFHLFKIFQSRYCYQPNEEVKNPFEFKCIPLANNFDDLSEYFVRKSVIISLTSIRDSSSRSHINVREFLVDQLKYNDNSINRYSDSYYLSSIINCLAIALIPTVQHDASVFQQDEDADSNDHPRGPELRRNAIDEVERYRTMDRLVPSYQNVISIAALEFNIKLMITGIIPNNGQLFIPYTRQGNYAPLRIVAFDCLLLLGAIRHRPIIQYISTVLGYDESRVVKRALSQSIVESLIVLMSTGELAIIQKKEPTFIEEEAKLNEIKEKDSHKSEIEKQIKSVRKDIGKLASLRAGILNVLLLPNVDCQVRWTLLQLCDALYKGNTEHPPKVKVKLPIIQQQQNEIEQLRQQQQLRDQQQQLLEENDQQKPVKIKLSRQPTNNESNKVIEDNEPSTKISLKKKKVPQAQKNGMSAQDVTACRAIHKRLVNNKTSGWFLSPVDPIRDGAPNYFDVIKSPMDLGTISAKIEQGHYSNRFEFESDFKKIIENATIYNPSSSPVHKSALDLDYFFDKQWSRVAKTLDRANEQQANNVNGNNANSGLSQHYSPDPNRPKPQPVSMSPVRSASKNEEELPQPPPKPSLSLKLKPPKENKSENPDKRRESDEHKAKRPRVSVVSNDDNEIKHDINKELSDVVNDNVDQNKISKINKNNNESNIDKPPVKDVEEPTADDLLNEEINAMTSNDKISKSNNSITKVNKNNNNGNNKSSSSKLENEKYTPFDSKKCRIILRKLINLPEAAIFLHPVDPILNGCPTYLDEIKNPMDFGTISKKIDQKKYNYMEEFVKDVEQIFKNCRIFNGPSETSLLTAQTCDPVEKVWKKEWKNITTEKIPHNEKRSLASTMKQWYKNEHAFWFLQAVDPIALGIPHYNDIIPKENMRDLSLIQSNLENDQYPNVDAFESDLRLMINNAIEFNGSQSPVSISAKVLLNMIKNSLNEFKHKFSSHYFSHNQSQKRPPSMTGSNDRSSKKSKLS